MIEHEVIIDYAYPCMMAEKALKDLHNAMLARDFEQAISSAFTALAETKMTLNSIVVMRERENAIRK